MDSGNPTRIPVVKQQVARAMRKIFHARTNIETMQHGTQNATPGERARWRAPRSWRDASQSVVFVDRPAAAVKIAAPA
jgi:hypothetical protein